MERFRILLCRHNVEISFSSFINCRSEMITAPGICQVTVNRWIDPSERNETVALQLGQLELEHPYPNYRELSNRWWRSFWDRQAAEWAAGDLILDSVLERARRGDWMDWDLAEECGVTVGLVGVRLAGLQRAAG